MKLAAIDIGSNAIRLQLVRVIEEDKQVSFKRLEYIRFPLRLGKDVFSEGLLSEATRMKFEKLMRTFKLLIDLYEVDAYVASATSAMREAKNGKEIVRQIATYFDLKINIIAGKTEAEILSKAIIPYLDKKNYVHIDVGGGSTELNIYVNKERISSKSFKIGSVRQLNEKKRKAVFQEIEKWINAELKDIKPPVIAVGTGGNINKLYKLSNQQHGLSISFTELNALRAYVSKFDNEQRKTLLKMNPDRADVILPASEIYIEVMKIIGADRILVPGVGLKDGLLYTLYENSNVENIKDIQFLEIY
ncbi:MAG: phosphatase [Bacteroidetes bacterium]|nr:phosphatase [Bacteroidota bacterium]